MRNFGRFTVYGSVPRLTVNNSPDFPDSNSAIIRLLGTIFMPKYTLEEKQKHLEDEFEIPMSNEMEEAMKEMEEIEAEIQAGKVLTLNEFMTRNEKKLK